MFERLWSHAFSGLDHVEILCSRAKSRLPSHFAQDMNIQWEERLVFVFCLIFVEIVSSMSGTVSPSLPDLLWYSLNLITPKIGREASSGLQFLVCVICRLLRIRLSIRSLLAFSFSCGLFDTSLLFSALKLSLVASVPSQLRVTLFIFTLVVTPLQGFGYRAVLAYYLRRARHRIANLVFNPKKDIDSETSLFFWMLPTAFVIAILLQTSSIAHERLAYHYSSGLAFVGICARVFRIDLNRFFFPMADIAIRYPVAKQTEIEHQQHTREQSHFRLLSVIASAGFCSLFFANGDWLLAIPFLTLLYYCLLNFTFPDWIIGSRSVLLLQSCTLVLVLCFGETGEGGRDETLWENLVFFFSLTRGVAASYAFSLEDFATFASDGALSTSFFILFSRYPFANTFLFFVSIACFFIELITRLGSKKLVLKEREAQNFVDHAIKQKFAGTGTALEIALADEVFRSTVSQGTLRVIQAASSECQLGSFLCHEATLKRQILDSTFVARPTPRILSAILAEWKENWKEVEILSSVSDGKECMVADWVMIYQIFQGLHCRAQHRDPSFQAKMTVTLVSTDKLCITVERTQGVNPALTIQTCELFAECIGGAFTIRHGRYQLTVPVSLVKSHRRRPAVSYDDGSGNAANRKDRRKRPWAQTESKTPVISDASMFEAAPDLPANLLFAVLDDSAMIRVNLRITCLKSFNASSASVFCGENEEEALGFCKLCLKLKPDIVILDENLDYTAQGGSLILGSGVADDLRSTGYQGIIVMHSANELLRDGLDYSIVDGFIVKGATRILIKNELARIVHAKLSSRK